MKLQGISKEGMKRLARKVKGQAEGDRIIDGITFRWDDESNPDDPGWVYLDTYSDPQAVPGNEGRDPQATDEELFTAAFGRAPEGLQASRRRAQEEGTGGGIRDLTIEDVEITVTPEPEDQDYHDDLYDESFPAAVEEMIDNYGLWGWCIVNVKAQWGGFEGNAYLGGVSVKDEEDFVKGNSDYYEQMIEEALAELNAEVQAAYAQFETIKASRRRAQERGTGGSDYWQTVKAIAEEIRDEHKEHGGEVSDMIWEEVDGSEYIIYYHKNLEVLQNSPNDDAFEGIGAELDLSNGWRGILMQVATWAMQADVQEAVTELGWDGDSFIDDDDDWDDEEDF